MNPRMACSVQCHGDKRLTRLFPGPRVGPLLRPHLRIDQFHRGRHDSRRPPLELPPLPTGRSALLLVDLQHGTCGLDQPERGPHFRRRFQGHTLPRAQQTLPTSQGHGLEVIHTVITDLAANRRDCSLDYKRCGMGFTPGSRVGRVIQELQPLDDELVLLKSSPSPTPLDTPASQHRRR